MKNHMKSKKNKPDISLLVFKGTLLVVVFLLGGFLAKSGSVPFKLIEKGLKDTEKLAEETTRKRPMLLGKSTYKGDGVTIHKQDQAYQGLTVMQGWFPEGPQARLVDMDGNVIHTWMIDFFEIWDKPEHIYPKRNIPKTRFNYHTMGLVVLKDGSIVANVQNQGAVKLDKCGEVIWTVDRMTHHSVTPTEDGGFWMPGNRDLRKVPDDLLFLGITRKKLMKSWGRYENVLLYVDANGEIKKEFSVLQAVADANFEHQIYDAMMIRENDPTHTNDIEIVTEALAAKLDNINAGDLLVSIRQFHMLAIFDQDDGRIKWHQTGPWVRQHDPDITDDGDISVFNNRNYHVNLNKVPGSNITVLDPVTRQARIVYPQPGQKGFYTDIMGSHQALPNGNMLIVVSRHGRVSEIDAEGDTVWEYVKMYDEEYASLIEWAERYDADYFAVNDWTCD
jgi:hypothetical protein